MRGVALDRLDQVRDQVVAALELHVDPAPGLVDAVAQADHAVAEQDVDQPDQRSAATTMMITMTMRVDPSRCRGRAQGGVVRGGLELVRRAARAPAAEPVRRLDRERDQAVGEPGVLGQQRAVQVGADQVEAPDALVAVAAVVAVAVEDAAERLGARAEVGAPAVVLEARRARSGPSPRSTSIETLPIRRGPGSRTVSRSAMPSPGTDCSPSW